MSLSGAVLLPSCLIVSPFLGCGSNEISVLCNSVKEKRGTRADLEMNRLQLIRAS